MINHLLLDLLEVRALRSGKTAFAAGAPLLSRNRSAYIPPSFSAPLPQLIFLCTHKLLSTALLSTALLSTALLSTALLSTALLSTALLSTVAQIQKAIEKAKVNFATYSDIDSITARLVADVLPQVKKLKLGKKALVDMMNVLDPRTKWGTTFYKGMYKAAKKFDCTFDLFYDNEILIEDITAVAREFTQAVKSEFDISEISDSTFTKLEKTYNMNRKVSAILCNLNDEADDRSLEGHFAALFKPID